MLGLDGRVCADEDEERVVVVGGAGWLGEGDLI